MNLEAFDAADLHPTHLTRIGGHEAADVAKGPLREIGVLSVNVRVRDLGLSLERLLGVLRDEHLQRLSVLLLVVRARTRLLLLLLRRAIFGSRRLRFVSLGEAFHEFGSGPHGSGHHEVAAVRIAVVVVLFEGLQEALGARLAPGQFLGGRFFGFAASEARHFQNSFTETTPNALTDTNAGGRVSGNGHQVALAQNVGIPCSIFCNGCKRKLNIKYVNVLVYSGVLKTIPSHSEMGIAVCRADADEFCREFPSGGWYAVWLLFHRWR